MFVCGLFFFQPYVLCVLQLLLTDYIILFSKSFWWEGEKIRGNFPEIPGKHYLYFLQRNNSDMRDLPVKEIVRKSERYWCVRNY